MVFLPYLLLRPFFPKTQLRTGIKNDNTKTTDHKTFYILSIYAIKFFVLFGKHYIGLFINSVRYLGGLSTTGDEKILHFMMIGNCGTVSIGMFLHTLRFKNVLRPKISMSLYLMMLYTPMIAVA